jgi:hypothetical protein
MSIQTLQLAHELDAAWIIALWKAIHGGDPAPEAVAAQAIGALAPYLKAAEDTLTFSQLETQFKSLGADVTEKNGDVRANTEALARIRQYCFKFKGNTYCVQLPTPRTHVAQ